jgi:predicted dehydrogenase
MIKLAQLGCGYWGPNLLRNFSALPDCAVKWVVDASPERREFVEKNFPLSRATDSWDAVLADDEVSAVVIATPAASHATLVEAALRAGKHVLVEKPLALSTADADRLIALARQQRLVLMAGHTFLFNNAVRFLKDFVASGEMGDLYYCYSQRLNLGQLRSDVNAWWNLAPHDVSILLYLMDGVLPSQVSARGMDYLQDGIEDVVFANLQWGNRVSAMLHMSWLDPHKTRRFTLVGSRKMVIYDDMAENPVTIHDKGFERVPRIGERMDFDVPPFSWRPQSGSTTSPQIERCEPLRAECAHFIECVRGGAEPLSGGRHARDTVAVLEAVQTALKEARIVCL